MVLGALINHPERLNRDTLYELRNIVARYPYFQTARLLLLNNLYLLHEADFGTELRRSVLYIADRRALQRLIEGYTDKVTIEDKPVDENPGIDRTLSLIDAFLGTLPDEHAELPIVPDAIGDYASRFLLNDEDTNSATSQELHADTPGALSETDSITLVLNELKKNDGKKEDIPSLTTDTNTPENDTQDETTKDVHTDEESLDESYFTETLAKIYIKQHKYSRALEIIRSLYLKYPEKNIYFADQIRFLEKLIINNNSK